MPHPWRRGKEIATVVGPSLQGLRRCYDRMALVSQELPDHADRGVGSWPAGRHAHQNRRTAPRPRYSQRPRAREPGANAAPRRPSPRGNSGWPRPLPPCTAMMASSAPRACCSGSFSIAEVEPVLRRGTGLADDPSWDDTGRAEARGHECRRGGCHSPLRCNRRDVLPLSIIDTARRVEKSSSV